jgi:hypothetical protein
MTALVEDFYRSSNGDRWQLLRDTTSGREVVRHEPNLTSGGKVTETDVQMGWTAPTASVCHSTGRENL